MSAHTPGTWLAVGDWVELVDDTRADICSVNPCDFGQSSYGRNDDEMRANARLIAAAPDLLEALQLVRDYVATMKGMGHQYQVEIDAAIAKAKGETA